MKKLIYAILCGLILIGGQGISLADDSASHTVTITVASIDDVNVTGGNVTLAITALDTPTSNSATGLNWTTNQVDRKITVQSTVASVYGLTVDDGSKTGTGTGPGSPVTIGATAADFISNIDTGPGDCSLVYTAQAEPTDGTATENHTVTYTICAGP